MKEFLVSFKHNGKVYENYNLADGETVEQLKAQGVDVLTVAKEGRKTELSQATDRYFYYQAKARGGYLNMGEIVHDAGEGDPDAQFLLKLYDAIWEKEEELEKQIDSMSLEELLNLNIEAWVKPLYDQIVAELENTSEG